MRRVAFTAVLAMAAIAATASACGPPNNGFPPDLVTIQGQVLQGTVPAAGALVYATDNSQIAAAVGDASLFPPPVPTIADGTGHFSIYGFGRHYDLAISPQGSPLDITVVRDLTSRTPRITMPAIANAPTYACHIDMSWSAPPPAGTTIGYFLQGPGYPGVELIDVAQTDANFLDGLDATWRGSVSTSANLWVVTYTQDSKSGVITNWNGFATAQVNLVDQRHTSFFTVLQTTTASPVAIQVQPASGYSVDSVDVTLDFGSGTGLAIAHFDAAAAASSSLSISAPDLPANRLLVRGVAHNGGAISFASAAPGLATPNQTNTVQLAFAEASQLTAPKDGATDVDSATTFSWNGDGVNEISFSSSTPNTPSLTIVTQQSSLTLAGLPQVTAAQFPTGTTATWTSRRYPDIPFTDTLEATGFDVSIWRSATSAPQSFTFTK